MFSKILIPVDGSENSFRALRYGAEIAKRFDAQITVLHVVPLTQRTIGLSNSASVTLLESLISELHREGEGYLAEAEKILQPYNVRYTTQVQLGAPASEICRIASDGHDLIVIGSRGMGEVKGLLLGSVSDRVSHTARQPVMIIH